MDPTPTTDIKIPPVIQTHAVLTYATPDKLAVPAGWTNTETYLLAPEKRLNYLLAVGILNLIATILFSAIALAFMSWGFHKSELLFALIFLCVFGTMQGVAFTRTIFRVNKQWTTFRLIIADQGLIQMSDGFPTVRVEVAEILRLVDMWDVMRIYISKNRFVAIPKRVDHWPALKARLDSWQKSEQKSTKKRIAVTIGFVWAISLASMAFFFWGQYSTNPQVILTAAAGVTLILLIRLWFLFRQKGIPIRTWVAFAISALLPLLLVLRWLMVYFHII